MALKRDITFDTGVTANYHRITSLDLRINEDSDMTKHVEIDFELSSYINKELRDSGKSPVFVDLFHFELQADEQNDHPIIALAYTKLKELDDWKDSEDV